MLIILSSWATFAHAAGPLQRVANTTLQFPPAPPQFGYTINNALPTVSLSGPVYRIGPKREELGRAVRTATDDIGKRLAAADTQPHAVPFDDPSRLPVD